MTTATDLHELDNAMTAVREACDTFRDATRDIEFGPLDASRELAEKFDSCAFALQLFVRDAIRRTERQAIARARGSRFAACVLAGAFVAGVVTGLVLAVLV